MGDEPSLRSLMKPRFRGTLLGLAVGDALGFPHEGSSQSFMAALGAELTSEYGTHRSGYHPPGQFSDDTQMSLAVVDSILEARGIDGEVTASHFVPLWRESRIVGRSPTCTAAMNRLMTGEANWETCGAGQGFSGNGAVVRAAPVGLWDFDHPDRIVHDVQVVSSITHRDSRAIAGAAALAAAVAYNVTHREVILGEFIDSVSGVVSRYDEDLATAISELPRFLSMKEHQALAHFADLDSGTEAHPLDEEDGLNAPALPSIMEAIYYFLRSPGDFSHTVGNCLRLGGDVDTRAAMAGALSGAINGVHGIPENLVNGLFNSKAISDVADKLYQLKESKRR